MEHVRRSMSGRLDAAVLEFLLFSTCRSRGIVCCRSVVGILEVGQCRLTMMCSNGSVVAVNRLFDWHSCVRDVLCRQWDLLGADW